MERVTDIRPVQQWGAFYLTRLVLSLRTQAQWWLAEAFKIIVKILLLVIAFALDLLTGILFILFKLLVKILDLIFSVLKMFLLKAVERTIGLLAFGVGIVLAVAIAYALVKHWSLFTQIIDNLINLSYGK